LPSYWDVSAKGFQQPATFEPIRLVKALARYPHTYQTSFANGHAIDIGDQTLLSPMKAVLLMPPFSFRSFEHRSMRRMEVRFKSSRRT